MTDQTPAHPQRLTSLDVFRGLTMAAMLVVNNPGSWDHVYPPLRHAQWHGCTFTDLVFPFFLFAVGLSMAFSRRLTTGANHSSAELAKTYVGILKRAAILIALGLLLNLTSVLVKQPIDLSRWRFPGVLQRIGVCYLLAAIIVLHFPRVWQYLLGFGILVGYWFLLSQIPVPGWEDQGPVAWLSPEGNMAGYIDRLVFTESHMYKHLGVAFDPEGLLSTLPALVTTLIGFWTGAWLRTRPRTAATAGTLAFAGAAALAIGYGWSRVGLPLNKNLWTSSYVVFTAGWSLLTLGVCWLVCEVLGSRRDAWKWGAKALWPFEVLGLNAILAFVGSGLLARLLGYLKIDVGSGPIPLSKAAYGELMAAGLSPINASLAYALLTLTLWWLVLWVLYWRKWFWKV